MFSAATCESVLYLLLAYSGWRVACGIVAHISDVELRICALALAQSLPLERSICVGPGASARLAALRLAPTRPPGVPLGAGYPEYELRSGGDDIPVTSANVGEYLAAVVHATLGSGIAAQVEAFRSGFNEVRADQTISLT
jgi:hypothetical protein